MKKIALTIGLFVGLSTFSFAQDGHSAADGHGHNAAASAQTTAPTQTVAPASLADIKMEKLVHDYGNVMQGGNGECEFKFTNNGKEPLVITNCMGSCGCTVPQCPKEPILPGKSNVIKVKYDTNRVGGIYKTVTVNSNAKSGTVVLTIKGNIEQKPVEETFPANKPAQGAPTEKKG